MLIRNVRLIGALSGGIDAEHGAVRMEQGRIVQVYGDAEGPELSAGEAAFDGGGRTLLPGLIDAHTHLSGLRDYDVGQLRNPMRYLTTTGLMAQRYLDYGFTTIRDCGTPLRVNSEVRDAIGRGLFRGPRILSCGLIIEPTEEESDSPISGMYSCADSPDEARKAVRQEIAEQADFVKIMASGSALDRHGIPDQPIMTEPECRAIVEAAAMKHTDVAAHAHSDAAIRMCIETGVHTIEHASFISEGTLGRLKAENTGRNPEDLVWLVPTVSAMYQNPETTAPEWMFLVRKLLDMLEISSKCLRRAYEGGAPMAFGTDSCPGMDQYEQGIEFRFRSEKCGFSNMEILKQATVNSAQALRLGDETGSIRQGLAADLILVDGKPDMDLSVMYRRPDHVWLAGEQVR